MKPEELIRMALNARNNAYAPYSGYLVGAALECLDGEVFIGCNVENASFPVTCCAERTALFAAISSGKRDFLAIAVVGGKSGEETPLSGYAFPCGMCRQALSEFGNEIKVYVAKSPEDYQEFMIAELLPHGFLL